MTAYRNIAAPTAGLEGIRRVGSLGVDVVDASEPERPFGPYAEARE